MHHEKSATWKRWSTHNGATCKEYKMKKVRHGKLQPEMKATRKKCATCKYWNTWNCNMKKFNIKRRQLDQNETKKSVIRKKCNMKNAQREKKVTLKNWQEWNMQKKFILEFLDCGRKSWTLDSESWTLDAGFWTLESGGLTLDVGLWAMDNGLWTMDSRRWTLDSGC